MSTKRTVLAMVLAAHAITALADDNLYYQIGGASPLAVSASAGLGRQRSALSMGVSWKAQAYCGNFDLGVSVSNALNGVSNSFQSLMGEIVQNAQAAVASLPALIIQRSYPALYELLSNGVLQGRIDFDRGKMSCQSMANKMADYVLGERLQQTALTDAWLDKAYREKDPLLVEQTVDAHRGDNGIAWVGGQRRGGRGQPHINVVHDVAKAGYNILHKRSIEENVPVSGGGDGWGSVPTNRGSWPGGGGQSGGASSGQCQGGMCTVWATPSDAANWLIDVVGETVMTTCDECEKVQGVAGTGLIRDLENEQQEIQDTLIDLVNGTLDADPVNLRKVSGGEGLAVSRGVIEAIQADPEKELLIQRLSSEMALSRTLVKAMWGRRVMLAGMSEPGIAQAASSDETLLGPVLNPKLQALERDIDALKTELEIRSSLAANTPKVILERAAVRTGTSRSDETSVPGAILDNRGRPTNQKE